MTPSDSDSDSDSDAPARGMANSQSRRTLLRGVLAILTRVKTPREATSLGERYEIQAQKSDILIGSDGCIERIVDVDSSESKESQFEQDNVDVVDCSGLLAIPGFVDTHRHVRVSLSNLSPSFLIVFFWHSSGSHSSRPSPPTRRSSNFLPMSTSSLAPF